MSSKSGDCAELVKTAALAVSLAIDDLAVVSTETPTSPTPLASPEPPTAPHAPAENESPPSPKDAVPSPPPSAIHVTATLNGIGSFGLGASATGGGRLGLDLFWRALQLGIENSIETPASSSASVAGGPNARLRTSLTTASAHACVAGEIPFFCGAVDVGSFQTEGEGITDPKRDATLFVAATVRAGARIWLGSAFFATASVDAVFPLVPYRAEINGTQVFSSPLVGGRGAVGLGVQIF